jgi:hypothetical protein
MRFGIGNKQIKSHSRSSAMRHTQTEEGRKLEQLIKRAIADLELTTSEYEEIMEQAHADSHIDADEQRLLHELQQLIMDGVVKRVPG